MSETKQGSETVLNYGAWQLSFINDRLERRYRVLVTGHVFTRDERRRLEKEIPDLSRGMSISKVRALFGKPETIYEIYEGKIKATRVLRYGPWELSFVGGKLSQRSQ